MVGEAQRSRAPIQKLADAVSRVFVPAVVAVAAVTFVVWAAVGPPPRLGYALVNAVAVLIVACPCALGLATPMSIMVAAGKGAGAGVLFKNAEAIEMLGKVDTLIVDKTGTLTEGKPRLVAVVAAGGASETDVLRLAAAVERGSEHPLAAAIVAGAAARGVAVEAASGFQSHTGKGVTGRVALRRVAVGNRAFMGELGVDVTEVWARAEELRGEGATVMFVAADGRLAGLLAVADPIKPTAPEALRRLAADGVRVVMVTGDSRTTAAAVARKLAITEFVADVLPEQKLAEVEAFAGGRPRGRDGGRRHQRRPGAGAGPRRHRDGDGHRRRHRERGRHAGQGRPDRHRSGAHAVAGDDAQHPAEPAVSRSSTTRSGSRSRPACCTRRSASCCRR